MKWWGWVALVALVLGAVLRLSRLDLRPMHTDEAVHAVKFGTLLETGVYRYDKNEYHGPTLNYFTLLPAWLAGQTTLAELSEETLRIVPALFGVGLILLVFSFHAAGPTAIAPAAFILACSPMMSYFSRYYIQETLLVFFAMALLVAAFRFLATGRTGWAVAAGVSGGLMAATKETWVIFIGAMAASLLVTFLIRRREGADPIPVPMSRIAVGLAAGVIAGIAVAVIFFSSFFTHWEGVRDSVLAYETYFSRAGEEARHGHPWHYFFRMLTWWDEGSGPVWTEAAIMVFAAVGIIGTWVEGRNRGGTTERGISGGVAGKRVAGRFAEGQTAGERAEEQIAGGPAEKRTPGGLTKSLKIFLGVYACLMFLIVSVIPYKTPWLVLGALMPLILMAGWGVSGFIVWLPARLKVPGYLLLAFIGGHLTWQSYQASFELYDNPANPMVYSHPTDDVKQIAAIVEGAARVDPGNLPVQVVVSGDEYWPLPWYMRRLPQVGWWNAVTDEFTPTPVILVSADREADLVERLYGSPTAGAQPLYVPLFDRPMFLRPGLEIRGYVTLDLWNRMREEKG